MESKGSCPCLPNARHSIRLKDYDYSQAGYYFITVCAQNKVNVFGNIADGQVALNGAGKMVEDNWRKLAQRFPSIEMDEFIVMPNHIHGVIAIVGAPLVVAQNAHWAGTRLAPTLGLIIGAFKSITTNEYIKNEDWPSFNKHLWQRNYYEHVIRDENDLARIREYIVNNSVKWQEDEYYVK